MEFYNRFALSYRIIVKARFYNKQIAVFEMAFRPETFEERIPGRMQLLTVLVVAALLHLSKSRSENL